LPEEPEPEEARDDEGNSRGSRMESRTEGELGVEERAVSEPREADLVI
jgi:hypothetical protein